MLLVQGTLYNAIVYESSESFGCRSHPKFVSRTTTCNHKEQHIAGYGRFVRFTQDRSLFLAQISPSEAWSFKRAVGSITCLQKNALIISKTRFKCASHRIAYLGPVCQSLEPHTSNFVHESEQHHLTSGAWKNLAAEREETKTVLLKFLKDLGLSTNLSSRVAKKGGQFVDHLLLILHTRYHHLYIVGKEPTTTEIQKTLVLYLEALAAEHREGLLDFLVYFPDPPPTRADNFGKNSSLSSTGKPFPTTDGLENSYLTLDGNFKPSVSYALSLGLTLKQVEAIAKKCPSFISCRPERNVHPVVSFFLGLGVGKAGIVKILLKRPQIFLCNLEGYLKPSMLYLESYGIKRSQWSKILVKFPALLTYGPAKLEAAVAFLHTIGFSSTDVGFIISRFPHVVSFSVEQKLIPTLEFLKSIGVDNLAVFLRRSPQVFGYSVEGNMKPTLRFLVELGYSQPEVITIINKFPQILGLAINSTIKPKWDYYAETGWPKSRLVAFPQYFGYSLETRIKPRFTEVMKRGLDWSPNRILSSSDKDFERLLCIHSEEGKEPI
ncbi:hypothetical protein KP509_07G072200 [Ceratopteris richardii]|uniref:Uncharacterized protein n=1 Tax=Ceratopteris richardii TaxID=49495 RepID=A0A8T2UG68_CERRI|nr:hypothetical protein KP509_07G072200 [Ceratopteris richardii]